MIFKFMDFLVFLPIFLYFCVHIHIKKISLWDLLKNLKNSPSKEM